MRSPLIQRILLLSLSAFCFAGLLDASETASRDLTPATYSVTNKPSACVHYGRCGTEKNYGVVGNPLHRAGHPETISPLAVPSNRCRYDGYYVGGGLPVGGEGRCVAHEGTWGWDYFGILFTKRIALNWGHGARHQGGGGAYKTDGPKLRHE